MADQNTPRAFSGIDRLYGNGAYAKLRKSSITIVGVGGVGSWTTEAIARHGIQNINIIDLDNVAESNINRQLQALQSTLGMAKVDAIAQRIALINPESSVACVEDFLTPDNAGDLLSSKPDAVIDCTDRTAAKVAMAEYCHQAGIPLFMAGAAGGRTDPTRIRHADLGATQGDALLARVRALLRRNARMNVSRKEHFGIEAVYSAEAMRKPVAEACDAGAAPQGLNCAGYGSSVCVTAGFGFALAARAIEHLLKQ
ncbi:ThiF family adenylyltransferase [Methyloversatilis discipulorum]|uniref:tRNA threonylcarbamoyladenosine dehydratase n=1 Tax=Methyloversatilis discipulorum TaxID=1119528 RepID=UPI00037A4F23|nr:tRNA threonylcarbamoyladenosine dehydratase [Methyloversatilis discipulorum]